jgi:hypothetical protein
MGLTVAPIEVIPFWVVVFVLKRLLRIPSARGSVDLTRDVGPADTRRGVAGPMAYVFLFLD